ncbi:MAG TPA: DUF4442 domain-containing protein [Gemmatimonadaceae bacterium]|nr:DUF4442 domain-containing protein [Gemmatimonadaceae bacterium]
MAPASPGSLLLSRWNRLRTVPGGARIFALLLSRMVPYSGTVHPVVLELRAGFARVRIHDRRRVRNHLRSVHAMALANLGELASGLALTTALPADRRAILTGFSISYVKKARGTLVAEGSVDAGAIADGTCDVVATIHDRAGDAVARVQAHWLVSAVPRRDG